MHRAVFLGVDGSAIEQDLQKCSSPKDRSFPRPENMKENPLFLPFSLQKNKFGQKRNIDSFTRSKEKNPWASKLFPLAGHLMLAWLSVANLFRVKFNHSLKAAGFHLRWPIATSPH